MIKSERYFFKKKNLGKTKNKITSSESKNMPISGWKRFWRGFAKGFERFGRAMLAPVSVLPIMALIGAMGYVMLSLGKKFGWMDYKIYKDIAESIKMIGMLPIYNIDILFAIGLAAGLAKTEKLSAALSGMMSIIALYFASDLMIKFLGVEVAKGATITRFGSHSTGYNYNALGGIMAGGIGYFIHKYTYRLQFPKAIAFFGGPKFSPVASALFSFLLGFPLAYIWVYISDAMEALGKGIRSMKAGGSFVYGLTNRLLLPMGLHNVPNAILRYTEAGGTWTDPTTGEVFKGFYSILLAKTAKGAFINEYDSMISNGTYPTNIFALPGAAVAMLLAVPKDKRKSASVVIMGAVSSAILSGVTEPIEFTFLFVSPVLFGIHAIMTGLTYMFMFLAGSGMVAGTGEGIITWFAFNATGAEHIKRVWMLWAMGPLFFFEYLVVFYFMITKLNIKTPGREGEVVNLISKKQFRKIKDSVFKKKTKDGEKVEDVNMAQQLIQLYGGLDNMTEVSACISRLRIRVKDKSKVQKQQIKDLGSSGVIENGMQVQSIFGAKALVYSRIINEAIKDKEQQSKKGEEKKT